MTVHPKTGEAQEELNAYLQLLEIVLRVTVSQGSV